MVQDCLWDVLEEIHDNKTLLDYIHVWTSCKERPSASSQGVLCREVNIHWWQVSTGKRCLLMRCVHWRMCLLVTGVLLQTGRCCSVCPQPCSTVLSNSFKLSSHCLYNKQIFHCVGAEFLVLSLNQLLFVCLSSTETNIPVFSNILRRLRCNWHFNLHFCTGISFHLRGPTGLWRLRSSSCSQKRPSTVWHTLAGSWEETHSRTLLLQAHLSISAERSLHGVILWS